MKTPKNIYECKARGIFRKDSISPLVGDFVDITILDNEKCTGNIDAIHPRKTQLVRPAVANVDTIAIVVSPKFPSIDFLLLDKLLITAETKNIEPLICINKIDLDEDGIADSIKEQYSKSGYRILMLSTVLNTGFDQLKDCLCNRITVFAGQSGVGKSSVLNRIMESFIMETGDLSKKIERGRHTTRHAELLQLSCGGFVADTPGFSSFELSDIEFDKLDQYYPEFREFLGQCRFTGCSHISEPDCAVKEALSLGKIGLDRYNRYIELNKLLKEFNNTRNRKRR